MNGNDVAVDVIREGVDVSIQRVKGVRGKGSRNYAQGIWSVLRSSTKSYFEMGVLINLW